MKCRLVFVLWLSIAGMVATAVVGCARVPERIVLSPGHVLVKDVVLFEDPQTGEVITGDMIYPTREWLENTEEGRREMKELDRAMIQYPPDGM